jgi:YVTN family beta-propeller protein
MRLATRAARATALALALALPAPSALASPFAYVTHQSTTQKSVSVIDLATRSVRATIPLNEKPESVAVHPDGHEAYVAADDRLVVIDTRTNTATDVMLFFDRAEDVAVSPDGSKVYVCHENWDHMTEYDVATRALHDVALPFVDCKHVAASPDGRFLWVVTEPGDVWQRTNGSFVLRFDDALPQPSGLAVDPFGTVYIGSEANRNVKLFAVGSNGTPGSLLTLGSNYLPGDLAFDVAALGFGGALLIPKPDANEVARWVGATIPVAGGRPLAAAGAPDDTVVIANANDVTGSGLGGGSVSLVGSFGRTDLAVARTPESVAVGPQLWSELQASPGSLGFTYLGWNRSYTRRITVTSSGYDDLSFGQLRVSGRDVSAFRISADGCSSQRIAPGASCNVDVTFTSVVPGTGLWLTNSYRYAAQLELRSNGARGPAAIPLSGTPLTLTLGTLVVR